MDPPVIGLTSRTLALKAANQLRPAETVARAYIEAVEAAGALVLLFPNGAPESATSYLDLVDGLLLTGGDDPHPSLFGEDPHRNIEQVDERRDHFEIALARLAHDRGLPVFGICRGAQLLNIARGGDIYQDLVSQTESGICHAQRRVEDGPWHDIEVAKGSRLAAILGTASLRVNSFHHQACRALGAGLSATAHTSDGLIEAVEDAARPFFVGVQWHPEIPGGGPAGLFDAFVKAAREFRETASKERREVLHGR